MTSSLAFYNLISIQVVFMLVAVSVVIGVQKVVDITHSLNEDNPRWPDGKWLIM